MLTDENNLEKWEKWRELFFSPRKFSNIWDPQNSSFFLAKREKEERKPENRFPIFQGGMW
jgi:hypothetical protein